MRRAGTPDALRHPGRTLAGMATHAIEAIDVRTISVAEIADLHAFRSVLRTELRPEDPPVPLDLAIARLRNIPEHNEIRLWVARDGDAIVADATAGWEPAAKENRHILDVSLSVLASHRQRGIAAELLGALVALADTEQRRLLIGWAEERVPAGRSFAERLGAKAGLEMRISRLMLDQIDRSLIERWVSEGPQRAPDYELVFIDGDLPEEIIEPAIRAFDVMNTAPRENLEVEDWKVTPEHIRAWEKARAASGGQLWTLFVRHRSSGELVGFTEIGWNPKVPGIIEQMGTAVDPAHRGHALGKWMKGEMLRRLLAEGPIDAREIRTGNAQSNDAMLGINVELGFTPWQRGVAWQLEVEDAKRYLATRSQATV